MLELIKIAESQNKAVMVDYSALNQKDANDLGMTLVYTNDPWDGAIMSYWVLSEDDVNDAEQMLANGVNLFETPLVAWSKNK